MCGSLSVTLDYASLWQVTKKKTDVVLIILQATGVLQQVSG